MAARRSRKGLYIGVAAAVVVVGGAAGLVTLKGAAPDIDPAKLATVEQGTMVKSVVATGKVEPITKVEINRELLAATLRGAEANLEAAKASLQGAEAQLQKNTVEAEGPDVAFAQR